MLTYHPAYDVNHCAYRLLLILESAQNQRIKWEVLRMIDFYILFPSLLKQLSLPKEYIKVRKHFNSIPQTYETISNPTRLMFELANIQIAGLTSLIAKNLISKEEFAEDYVLRTKMPVPNELNDKILNDDLRKAGWFIFLTSEFSKIDFYGPRGLKSRTGLMEFKYDIS